MDKLSVLEKAARALADHFGMEWETTREEDRVLVRGYVRAVLLAVRGLDGMPSAFHLNKEDRECFSEIVDAILENPNADPS